MPRPQQTDKFVVRGDDGNDYLVIEYTEILDDSAMGRLGSTKEGVRSYQTADGRTVNRRGDQFNIVGDGLVEETVMATRID